MSWFHYTKQERLQRARHTRREYAEDANKAAHDNIFLIPHTCALALKLAQEEERTFRENFQETMPQHMLFALNIEIALWKHLADAIDSARERTLTDADYDQVKENVRAFITHLIDLLDAEIEMVTSCLVRHYVDIVHTIQTHAARVDL